ncbi:Ubiquitin carboxyl-terminal hydrolase family protein [Cryptosporidium meleagridis]|uniref:ubiquitinyl hydrolase 1 n=1 Tax=Cryptosporidium meleagridis TaxID=93969 RepID=A0A2P4YZW7_9CRYT|nr:Ubiquitin carboxyl-terminal hydrolase family protein [Cryptosporidium meleagridis]
MASNLSQEAEKRQGSHPVTLQLSNRLVNFVSGGLLCNKTSIDSSYVSDNSIQKHMDKFIEKEPIENNVPLAKPEYYYFPPELLTDARDFLEPKEISQFRPYGRGLANPGWNVCYFNSILQALTYAPYLSIDCLRRNHQKICRHMKDHLVCIMCMFEDHVNIMLDNTSKSNTKNDQPIVSSFIKCAQKLIWKRFRIGMMHDAQEFLRYFLEALHKSCLPKNLQTDQTFRKIHPIAASTTYIGQLFCGFFLSRIVCHNCQYTSNTYDPFMDVPLDIMGVSNLENALKLFTKIEYLKGENRYMCPKCNQKSDASKQILIEKPPPLLTIQLKRFSYVGHGSRKPNKAINFSDVLDLQPYMSSKTRSESKISSSTSESSYIYKLWAVVCHSGNTLSCGHYYTHAKSIDNKWYCFNDDYVKPTRIENVLNENHKAYLLFYYRSDFNKFDLLRDSDVSIESLGKSQIITPLAPEVSFINLQFKADSKSSISGKNNTNNPKESSNSEQNVNEFLDQLLRSKSKEEGGSAQNQDQDPDSKLHLDKNQQNSSSIKLVLNPRINTDVNSEELDSRISISKSDQAEKVIKAKICNFKLRSLLLCDNWITRSKPRRNLATIFYLKKLKKLGLLTNYFINSKSRNCSNGKALISNINKSQIDTWEDLDLSDDTIKGLEEAQKSLLARSNIRSDYDKEYDRGKVKKPLRQAILASTSTNNSNRKNTNSRFQAKKSAFIEKGNIKDFDTLSTSELFDIAFKNKGNLKNKNKRRNVRVR